MDKLYTYTSKWFLAVSFLLAFIFTNVQQTKASHFAGGDIEYTCTGNRTWKIKLTLYRDCTGCATCYSNGNIGAALTGGMVAKPNTTLNPAGCTPNPSQVNMTLTLVKVEDVGKDLVAICGNLGKNGCNNLGTVTPGPFTPSIEKWIFEGTLNMSAPTLNNSCAKYWDISYSSNARNTGMSNIGAEDFSIGATINIFDRSAGGCKNNSPVIKNEPVAIVCSGQENILNMGAVDPDNDSLTYQIKPANRQYPDATANYINGFSFFNPFPLNGQQAPHTNYPQPNGPYVLVDTTNGDVGFNAINNTPTAIFGDITVYIYQWTYDAAGQPFIVGITMRDMQIYVINCPANNPPRFETDQKIQPGNRPKYDYTVCAGEKLCFDVLAKDTDVYPTIPRYDSTVMSWNQGIQSPRASFLPVYGTPTPTNPKPREDRYRFCWETEEADGRTLPYYFTITALDNYCPRVGRITRSFSVRVSPIPKGDAQKINQTCGKHVVRIRKTDPKQTFTSATLEIANSPYDWSFNNGSRLKMAVNPNPPAVGAITDPRVLISDTFTYTVGGRYLIKYTMVIPSTEVGTFCTKVFTDTLVVDTPVRAFVNDTFVCKGTNIPLTASARWGNPAYRYTWFKNTLTSASVAGPSNLTGYTATDTVTTKYYVRVADLQNCMSVDSMVLEVKALPTPRFMPDTARICFGESFTLDPGNSGGRVAKYTWSKGTTTLNDSTPTIIRSDSGNFNVLITDSFGCKKSAMFTLRVNQKVLANAGKDTSVCPRDTVRIGAIGGMKYKWDILQGAARFPLRAKGTVDSVSVSPTVTTDYIVTTYYTYPDTTKNYHECFNEDTIRVVARSVPVLNTTTPQNYCRSNGSSIILPFRTVTPVNQQGGVGVWSFRPAPGAVTTSFSTSFLFVDSLPNLPKDTFYPTMLTNITGASNTYYVKYSYRGPVTAGSCLREDSVLIRIMALPKVNAGPDREICVNSGTPFQMDGQGQFPGDLTGKDGVWSLGFGGGLDSVTSSGNTKYSFNQAKPNVLLKPQVNVLRYRYTVTYNLPAPSTTIACANTDSADFSVVPIPVLNAGNDFAVCKNEPVFGLTSKAQATTTSAIPGSSYWSVAPNQNPNISEAILLSQDFFAGSDKVPANGGTWRLYYNDTASGCKVYDSVNIEVIRLPIADINYSITTANDSVCKTIPSVSLNGTPKTGGVGTYSGIGVDPNTGLFNVQAPGVVPQNWYTAYYSFAVTSRGTTCSGIDSIQTFVQAPPVVSVSAVNPKCAYDTTEFMLNASITPSFYGLLWTHDGTGTISNNTITNPTYKFDAGDVARQFLNVTATSTNNGVCVPASDTKRLDINPKPNAAFYCATCKGCEPLDAALSAKGADVGGSSYNWFLISNGTEVPFAPSDSAITKTMATNGVHIVKLKVSTPAGCTSETFDTITVYGTPQAAFEPDPAKSTIAKPFFSFINQSKSVDNQTLKYEWDMGPDPQLPKGSPNRIITDANPQNIPFGDSIACNIPVYLKVITEPGGCIDTAIRTICIDPDITVFIPSAFRPVQGANTAPCADPTLTTCNDYFTVYADGFATIEIYVFNRWGQQVFSSYTTTPGWNGKINNNGAECPQDVYIYQINATSYNGKKYTYSGSITLLR